MSGVVLLVETRQGGHVAVRFPNAEQARSWEDRQGVETAGCVPYVSDSEALKLAVKS